MALRPTPKTTAEGMGARQAFAVGEVRPRGSAGMAMPKPSEPLSQTTGQHALHQHSAFAASPSLAETVAVTTTFTHVCALLKRAATVVRVRESS